jgi:hypothetical protein
MPHDIPREAFCDVVQSLFRSLAKFHPLVEVEEWELRASEDALKQAMSLMEFNCEKRVNLDYMEQLLEKALHGDDDE